MPLHVASLFCGCGGLDLGFTAPFYKIILAVDSNQDAVDTYNANFTHKAVRMDVAPLKR